MSAVSMDATLEEKATLVGFCDFMTWAQTKDDDMAHTDEANVIRGDPVKAHLRANEVVAGYRRGENAVLKIVLILEQRRKLA